MRAEGAGEAVLDPRARADGRPRRRCAKRRGREALLDLCRGPGRLGQALAIGPELDGEPIGAGRVELTAGGRRPGPVVQTPRIGITPRARAAVAVPARGLALRQPVPSLTISVTSAPLAASRSGIGYCE